MHWKATNKLSLLLISLVAVEVTGVSSNVWGYESDLHQQLTFIAARQLNECVQDEANVARLSALDTRYIVKANVAQADGNFFVRMFRWQYYNRDDQTNRSAWGLVETRFHDRFVELIDTLQSGKQRRRQLTSFGQMLSFIQKVSSPPYVVPVFTGRWWRFSLGDRFNRFPIDAKRVESALTGRCAEILSGPSTYQQILERTAENTLQAVRSPIKDLPTTWESFWKFARKPDEFGEYGRAGNSFGQRTEFRCGQGQRCLLLENDPLYADFAAERHTAAVEATMQAMYLLQRRQIQPQTAVSP